MDYSVQTGQGAEGAGIGAGGLLVGLIIAIVMIVSLWKVFKKAGQPGWGCLIPIYNWYLMIKIARKPGWWLILMFIPLVNFIISIIVAIGIAENFGKGGGFAVGLILLPIIFYPMLAFGDAQYIAGEEPATASKAPSPPAPPTPPPAPQAEQSE